MVLAELGGRITRALQNMNKVTVIDEKALGECLNEITRALLQADVNIKMVMNMQQNIKKIVNLEELAAGHNKRIIIEKAIFNELCGMLDPGTVPFQPKKGKPSVIMFVGLQGAGKTTTCGKYAYHYQMKGFKPALVCADTFRAGAFDQLKQNATKAKIPFYGSYTETDPAKIGQEGVERFKKEGCDLIIVDTSGRHRQEASLFEEMRQVAELTSPDLIVFVMDSSIGQAAYDQAKAFKESVAVGAVIVTKMDGHAKGGGALKHMNEFEPFEGKAFVSRLLALCVPCSELVRGVHGAVGYRESPKRTEESSLGGGQVMSMIPGFNQDLMPKGREKESMARLKKFMTIMDSMTEEELDSSNPKLLADPKRIMRVARGSGRHPLEVQEMLEEYKRMEKIWGKMKGLKMGKMGDMNAMARNMNAKHLSSAIPPQMLQQMGGLGGIQNLMKQVNSKDFAKMFAAAGGGRE
eukprot:jgi/Mesen1/1561/ME000134S00680